MGSGVGAPACQCSNACDRRIGTDGLDDPLALSLYEECAGQYGLSGRVLNGNTFAGDHGSTASACETVRLRSALIRSPGRSTTRSSRTSWVASMTRNWLSRRTLALIGSSARSLCADRSARYS